MALDYFAPGVYVEEVDRGSRPIEGVSLSVAGFIGFTEDVRGGAEVFQPTLVTSWDQYLQYFAKDKSDGYTDFNAYLPFAVDGWFKNGGGRCWVTSIGTGMGKKDDKPAAPPLLIAAGGNRPSLKITAKEPPADDKAPKGAVTVSILPSTPPTVDGKTPVDTGEFFEIEVRVGGQLVEPLDAATQKKTPIYSNLSMVNNGAVVAEKLKDSKYVTIAIDPSAGGPALAMRPINGTYPFPAPPQVRTQEDFAVKLPGASSDRTGIKGLFEVDEVAMVACPDLMLAFQKGWLDLDQVHAIMVMIIGACETSFPSPPFRMAVIDAPPVQIGKNENKAVTPDQQKPQHVAEWLSKFNYRSQFAALYYPWIEVANPRDSGKPILVPPCGHMMGIWARVDQGRGVFKAPANETPRGVIGLAYEVNIREQELLNPQGINCIRNFSNYTRGYKVWGARTLVEPDNIQWRYISVRRLMSYIAKSIEMGTQWVVFEPNDQDLWARVTRTVSNFLEGLWRQGALFGGSPAEAFYVKCDATINTPDTIMKGRLYIEIGVAPVRPAEFVIFQISQWSPNQ
ncbi:phage tail sheath family protein [Phormidesmis sp. 146-35]